VRGRQVTKGFASERVTQGTSSFRFPCGSRIILKSEERCTSIEKTIIIIVRRMEITIAQGTVTQCISSDAQSRLRPAVAMSSNSGLRESAELKTLTSRRSALLGHCSSAAIHYLYKGEIGCEKIHLGTNGPPRWCVGSVLFLL
jgi:hypothetical protein